MSDRSRKIGLLSLYAAAMAYLEAAVVIYLRRIYYPETPLDLFPLRVWAPADLIVEMGREAATLIMIFGASALAERGFTRIMAAFLFIFGVWDLLYYAWLKVLIGWPVAWLQWDILFLIPWAWLSPWPAPALVAVIFVTWGLLVLGAGCRCRFRRPVVALFVSGCLIVLISFLQPAFPLLAQGAGAVPSFVPGRFWWGPYGAGLFLLGAGLLASLRGAEP